MNLWAVILFRNGEHCGNSSAPGIISSNSRNSPRPMTPASGFDEIMQEMPFIPANARRFHTGLRRNRPEKYTEDGSSIPAEIFLCRNRQRPSISCYRKENRTTRIPPDNHRNLTVSFQNWPETRKYSSVTKPSNTFPRISPRISHRFHRGFRWDFTRISP